MRRRCFVLLCAVVAVLGLVPGPALAVDPPPNSEPYTAPIDQPLLPGECYRDIKHGYYAKNVYGACWFTDMKFVHYACPDPACGVDGSAAAYVYTTLNVVKASRQVAVSHRFVNWRIDGVPDTARLGVTIACGPPDGGGGGFCDRPSVPVVKSIAEWKAAPDVTEVFSLDGEDAPVAGVSPEVAAEKRTQYRVTSRFVAEVPPGERYTVTDVTNGTGVRCDVARQLDPAYVRGADCVLRTWLLPWFTFSAGEQPIAETGAFVRAVATAGRLPGFPGVNGTSAGFTGPQYRLFYDVAARQAHRAAEAKCLQGWGPDWVRHSGGLTNVCAAYPFDESVQGAVPGSAFEVRPVLDSDNAEFQRRFTRFLAENHVLDGDGYYVYPLP